MSKINYIKPFYKPDDAQDDLHHDAITLMGINMTSNFKKYNKASMSKKYVDNLVKLFYNVLITENDLENEWDQTS